MPSIKHTGSTIQPLDHQCNVICSMILPEGLLAILSYIMQFFKKQSCSTNHPKATFLRLFGCEGLRNKSMTSLGICSASDFGFRSQWITFWLAGQRPVKQHAKKERGDLLFCTGAFDFFLSSGYFFKVSPVLTKPVSTWHLDNGSAEAHTCSRLDIPFDFQLPVLEWCVTFGFPYSGSFWRWNLYLHVLLRGTEVITGQMHPFLLNAWHSG